MEAYEIELVPMADERDDYWLSIFATLTGLSKEEISELWPEKLRNANSWSGQDFVRAARALKFNCNVRWVKFDRDTPWPCILRMRDSNNPNGGWFSRIYHQGDVYHVDSGLITALDDYLFRCGHLRITSMLQVWMSTDHRLLISER